MAGNNSIQILRCSSSTRSSSTQVLLNGQPMIETDTGLMYVGDGSTQARNLSPIAVQPATQNTYGGIKIYQSGNYLYIETEDI